MLNLIGKEAAEATSRHNVPTERTRGVPNPNRPVRAAPRRTQPRQQRQQQPRQQQQHQGRQQQGSTNADAAATSGFHVPDSTADAPMPEANEQQMPDAWHDLQQQLAAAEQLVDAAIRAVPAPAPRQSDWAQRRQNEHQARRAAAAAAAISTLQLNAVAEAQCSQPNCSARASIR